jgi:hypothetical protein
VALFFVPQPTIADESQAVDELEMTEKLAGWTGKDEPKIMCTIGKESRHKVRLVYKSIGTPFMDIQTPHQVLVVIYDLLEGECSSVYDTLFLTNQNSHSRCLQ